MKEGQSTSRPPLLEESNYGCWKAGMKVFLKTMDEKTWRAVVSGWSHPLIIDDKGVALEKPEETWTAEEEAVATSNSRALNAIFAAVDENNFRLISDCEVAKQAWEILQTVHERIKTPAANWRDEDSEEKSDQIGNVALMIETEMKSTVSTKPEIVDESDSSDDEEITEESTARNFALLYEEWLQVMEVNKGLTAKVSDLQEKQEELLKMITSLTDQVAQQEEKFAAEKEELNLYRKTTKMLNSGTSTLEDILARQRYGGGYSGLGYTGEEGAESTVFVKATEPEDAEITVEEPVLLQKPVQKKVHRRVNKKLLQQPLYQQPVAEKKPRCKSRRCYFCDREGHIQRRCPILNKYWRPQKSPTDGQRQMKPRIRRGTQVTSSSSKPMDCHCLVVHENIRYVEGTTKMRIKKDAGTERMRHRNNAKRKERVAGHNRARKRWIRKPEQAVMEKQPPDSPPKSSEETHAETPRGPVRRWMEKRRWPIR